MLITVACCVRSVILRSEPGTAAVRRVRLRFQGGTIHVDQEQGGRRLSDADTGRQGAKVGQPVILFRTSNSDPAEDFVASYQGRVSALGPGGARLVSASVLLHYGRGCKFFNTKTLTCTKYFPDDFAYQIQYAPYGVHTGLCVGTAATAANGTKVSLRPCSVSGKTIWIVDIANSTGHSFLNLYVPLINGSQTNFADPFVLTYPQKSSPTDMPRPQLATENLQYISHHGGVIANQQWGADRGALQ
jgi:hypothetical protein